MFMTLIRKQIYDNIYHARIAILSGVNSKYGFGFQSIVSNKSFNAIVSNCKRQKNEMLSRKIRGI